MRAITLDVFHFHCDFRGENINSRSLVSRSFARIARSVEILNPHQLTASVTLGKLRASPSTLRFRADWLKFECSTRATFAGKFYKNKVTQIYLRVVHRLFIFKVEREEIYACLYATDYIIF